jgi:hypothetical protein
MRGRAAAPARFPTDSYPAADPELLAATTGPRQVATLRERRPVRRDHQRSNVRPLRAVLSADCGWVRPRTDEFESVVAISYATTALTPTIAQNHHFL